jgi:hypothetical protein
MISDFTNNLILGFLGRYTETFAKRHITSALLKTFSVPKVEFNYETETWTPATFVLPAHQGTYVLLTPRDLLTKDNTWINKTDLLEDFDAIPQAIENAQLREQVSNYFRKVLKKDAKKEDRIAAAKATILEFPELIDYYIKYKEEHGKDAESISAARVRLSIQLYGEQFKTLALNLAELTPFYTVAGNTYAEAMQRVEYLKDVIENKGGHRLFYVNGEPLQRESDLHIAYALTWFATPSDVSREVNDGRGPADFKISRGAADKSIVEFKLAKNTHLKANLAHQTDIYKKASGATNSISVIMYFSAEERRRVDRILRELKLTGAPNIVLIDARRDNKPSGSKAGSA